LEIQRQTAKNKCIRIILDAYNSSNISKIFKLTIFFRKEFNFNFKMEYNKFIITFFSRVVKLSKFLDQNFRTGTRESWP
jgi:hypothetical protein